MTTWRDVRKKDTVKVAWTRGFTCGLITGVVVNILFYLFWQAF